MARQTDEERKQSLKIKQQKRKGRQANLKNIDGVLTNMSAAQVKKLTGMTTKELANYSTSGRKGSQTIKEMFNLP